MAHVPFIYLKYTYITTCEGLDTINWMGTQPICAIYITHQNSQIALRPSEVSDNVRTGRIAPLAFGVTPPAFPSNDAYADRRRQNLNKGDEADGAGDGGV